MTVYYPLLLLLLLFVLTPLRGDDVTGNEQVALIKQVLLEIQGVRSEMRMVTQRINNLEQGEH